MNALTLTSMHGASSPAGWIRGSALAFSILVHGALFLSMDGVAVTAPVKMPDPVVEVAFLESEVIPEAVPEPVEEVVEQPEEPAPTPEPVKPPEPVKKKVAEKKEPPKPVKPEKPVQKIVKVASPKPVAPMVEQPLIAAAPKEEPELEKGVIRLQREAYISDVMAHIERHKRYPKIARRMGVEGDVTVHFVLHADGSARNVRIEEGPAALVRAVKITLERSQPLPQPPADIDCPIDCDFRMRFRLSDS